MLVLTVNMAVKGLQITNITERFGFKVGVLHQDCTVAEVFNP